jgi:integrase
MTKPKSDAEPQKKNRRAHGEGGLYQRESDGKWVGTLELGWIDGKRKRQVIYGATQDEVRIAMTRRLADRDRGIIRSTDRQTVAQFLESWLSDVVTPSLRPATVKSYRDLVERHVIPSLGKKQLTKLSVQDVQRLLNERQQSGLSPRSVQYIRGVLRSALNLAMKWELVPRNVAALAQPPRIQPREMRFLTTDEALKLLEAARGNRLEGLYRVAIAIGLRQGEAFGLRWSDVDLAKGTLTVRNALQRIDGKAVLVPPKTARSRRIITVPPQLVAALKRHRAVQLADRMIAGPRWQEMDLVFSSPIGTPLDPSNIRRQLLELLKTAGLPPMRFHDLRHTAASLLVAEGVHPRTVMEILGHSQIAITMNTYSHVSSETMKDATNRMGALLMSDEETA